MMALFLGQDSARYEVSLKLEMEVGALSCFVFSCGFFFFRALSLSIVYPNYSRAYTVVGGFGAEVKVAKAGGKSACNSQEEMILRLLLSHVNYIEKCIFQTQHLHYY